MPRLNVGSIDLSERNAYWLNVAANINNEALRVRLAKIIEGHVKRFKNSYASDISFLARLYNLTWEQMFVLVARGPAPNEGYSPEDIAWAREQPPLVVWEEEQTHFGVEVANAPLRQQITEMEGSKDDDREPRES